MKINSLTGRMAIVAVGGLFLFGCDKMMSSHEQPGSAQTAANSTPSGSIVPPAVPETQNPEDKMPRISPEESQKLVKDGKAVIIDVRGTDAYKLAHIKGALDIPLNDLESGDYKGLPKNKRIIAYCTWPSEHTSARAAFLLDKAGFNEASALLGGMHAWENMGGEMVKQ